MKNYPDGLHESENHREWFLNNRRHREDGPAVEWLDDDGVYLSEWYKHDKLHRDGGPAREWRGINGATGTGHWYREGLLHREDGPAIEVNKGNQWWYLNGVRIPRIKSNEDFRRKIGKFGVDGLAQKQVRDRQNKIAKRRIASAKRKIFENLNVLFQEDKEFSEEQWIEIYREVLISRVQKS
jgi:hypothetical protein